MRTEPEYKTLKAMVSLFCRHHHKPGKLCKLCSGLLEYAEKRLIECPYENDKPICQVCHIHCYSSEMRKQIAEVMRFSGPRMIFHHPLMTLCYLIRSRKPSKLTKHSK
ncbi:MAG TPA: nitrous oxide-stimulated promoter family protein [Victivallales bacterium]|nr:nitrous oxide-stimulated promoter family protein [Victivallales bacterium]